MWRMRLTLRLLLKNLLLFVGLSSFAQSKSDCKFPFNHLLWHDRIDREQRNLLRPDAKGNFVFRAGENEDVNYYVTQAITQKIDALQCSIEKDSLTRDQRKIGYLSGLEKLLSNFRIMNRAGQFTASHFPKALEVFKQAMALDEKEESIEDLIDKNTYEVGQLILRTGAFNDNP